MLDDAPGGGEPELATNAGSGQRDAQAEERDLARRSVT